MITPLSNLTLITICIALIGCGGTSQNDNDDSINSDNENENVNASYRLKSPETNAEFETYIKQAFENSNQASPIYRDYDVLEIGTGHLDGDAVSVAVNEEIALESADTAAAPASSGDSSSQSESASSDDTFSTTYLQEAGVDESDLMKFDGEYLYIANQPQYYSWIEPIFVDPIVLTDDVADVADVAIASVSSRTSVLKPPHEETTPATIRVMQVEDQPASATEVATLTLDQPALDTTKVSSNNVNIDGLYLYNDRLTVLTGQSRYHVWDEYQYWSAGAVGIQTYNTTDPANITTEENAVIEGAYLIGSRRIGNSLYVVTRTTPHLHNFNWYPSSSEQIAANQTIIDELNIDDLLPSIKLSDGTVEPLVTADRCFLPSISSNSAESDRSRYYSPEIISIVRISLDDINDRDALCTTAPTQGIYMSQQALYLYGNQPYYSIGSQPLTVFHKFALSSDQPEYRGSGSAPGYLGWNSPAYRLGERDGALIAVTSNAHVDDSITNDTGHRLTVLGESDASSRLEQLAQLPNSEQPAVIGKPNESIYGVRIMGERAYVVTFERTDPLYVFDIQDPAQPRIAGELELPGFSEFLHPVNNELLLGIGHDADENGLIKGLKVSLFNVADIENPTEIESIIVGERGTSSPVTYNPKAFSNVNISDDEMRFTLPLKLHESTSEDNEALWQEPWQYTGLELFTLSGISSDSAAAADLTREGAIKRAETGDNQTTTWLDSLERGILLNDSVHYLSGQQLWSAPWDAPETAVGPQ